MEIKRGDIFRYYDRNDELWLGAVRHRTQNQMSVDWLLPAELNSAQARDNKPCLRRGQMMLFDKGLK